MHICTCIYAITPRAVCMKIFTRGVTENMGVKSSLYIQKDNHECEVAEQREQVPVSRLTLGC